MIFPVDVDGGMSKDLVLIPTCGCMYEVDLSDKDIWREQKDSTST